MSYTFLLGFSIINPRAPIAKQNNEQILFAPPKNLCAWQIVIAGTQHRKVNDASALSDFCRIFLIVSIGLSFRVLSDIIIAGTRSTSWILREFIKAFQIFNLVNCQHVMPVW